MGFLIFDRQAARHDSKRRVDKRKGVKNQRVKIDLIFNQLNTLARSIIISCDQLFMAGQPGVRRYLCKHWLPVLGDHGALITVHGDAGVVEGLLGVFEDVVELGHPALEHRAEVTGNQRPADSCRETRQREQRLNIEREKM